MKFVRRSNDRGHADHGWLKSYHSFSFADYYEPEFMGFRDLRVINQDDIAGGGGFPTHGHRDMEILTYVTEGALRHQDSEGNSEVIRPGEIQKMSAGSGIRHSEFNDSPSETAKLLQIWIMPNKQQVKPSYEQERIDWSTPGLKLIGTNEKGVKGAVHIQQDVKVYAAKQKDAQSFSFKKGRYYWVQLIEGSLSLMGEELQPGDALAYYSENQSDEVLKGEAHYLVFDLN
jgi:quercetin 2,3-dioxygenase